MNKNYNVMENINYSINCDFIKTDKFKLENENKQLIEKYDEFIDLSSKLVNEVTINNNSISMCYALNTLINNNVFSINQIKNINSEEIFMYKQGINIIKGEAVCRNYACFADDIMNKLNIYSGIFLCHQSNFKLNEDIKYSANHMANMIDYDGKTYIYDIYNDSIYNFINNITCEELFRDYPYYCYYTPNGELNLYDINENKIIDKLNKFDNSLSKPNISIADLFYIKKNTLKLIKNNNDLINDFINETKMLKYEIANTKKVYI